MNNLINPTTLSTDLGGMGEAVSELSSVARITVFTSDRAPLCKRFTLSGDTIRKETLATLYQGTAQVIEVGTAAALNRALDALHHKQAIATGVLKHGDSAQIGTAAQGASVARSLEHFHFDSGAGWLLWDYDAGTMPQNVAARVEKLGGPLAALLHIWPEARTAAHVVRPSSSDGIAAKDLPPTQSEGLHGFFLVSDVARSKAILDALEKRAWAEGLAWYALSKSGALLQRSIVDTAVGSPERLVFEAPPILDAPLYRLPRPAIVCEGQAIAPPYPAPDLLNTAETQQDRARIAIQPKAEKTEAAFIKKRARVEADKTGKPLHVARASIVKMMQGATLTDDHMLQMKSGHWARVGNLLDAGKNMSLPDPIEGIEYGRDKASLRIKPRAAFPNEKPALISHAHGVTTVYRFARYTTPPQPPFHPETKADRDASIKAHSEIARGFVAAHIAPIKASKAVKALYAEIDELATDRKAQQATARQQVRSDLGLAYTPSTQPRLDPDWTRVLLSGAQGVGKSAALVGRTDHNGITTTGALHLTRGMVTLMTAPDNAKANELALDYQQTAPDTAPPSFRLMGRSVVDQQTQQSTCLVAKPIETYAKKGGNVMAFCQVCPMRDQCHYLNEIGRLKRLIDAGEGVVIFAPQEYAFLPLPAGVTPDLIVMDEALRAKGAILDQVSLQDLSEPLKAEATGNAVGRFGTIGEQADAAAANLQHIQPLRVALKKGFSDNPNDPYALMREKGLSADNIKAALDALYLFEEKALENAIKQAATEYSFASAADGRKRSLETMLQAAVDNNDAKHSKAVRSLFEAVLKDIEKGIKEPIAAWRKVIKGEYTDTINTAALVKPHFSNDTPLLYLDGTADADMTAAIFGDITHHHHRVARNANVTQILGHRFSAQSITGARKDGTPHHPEKAEAVRQGIAQAVSRHAGALIGSTARVESALKETFANAGIKADTAHFSALRGRNTWENAPAVFLVGPEEPPATALEPIARAFAGADPATHIFQSIGAERYPLETRYLRTADKSATGVDVSHHPDPWVERVLVQTRDAEALQLIDRARLIYNAEPKQVFILAPVVLDLTVNEVVQWRDFKAGGSRIARAIEQGGVVPLSRGPLRAMYPSLWNSNGAAQRDGQSVSDLVTCLSDHSVNNTILFTEWSLKSALLIDYKSAPEKGKRMRTQRALVWAASVEQAKERLEALIGPVQHVEAVTGWVDARNNAADDIEAREDRLRRIMDYEQVGIDAAIRIADGTETPAPICEWSRNVATIAPTAPAPLRIETNLEPPPLARAGL